jgi:GH24 family phage-related lysozyme (muramidase)
VTIEVTGPDRSIVEFPEGTPTATMQTALAKFYGGPQTAGSALAQLSDPEATQPSSAPAGGQSVSAAQDQPDPAAGAAPNLALAALPAGGGYAPFADAARDAAEPWLDALAADPSPVWNARLGLFSQTKPMRDAAGVVAGALQDGGVSPALAGLVADPLTGGWRPPESLDEAGVAAGAGTDAKHPTPPAIGQRFMVSDAARDFIRNSELDSVTSKPYLKVTPDGNYNPTFGYGHRILPAQQAAFETSIAGLNTDQRQALAERLYDQDLANAQRLVVARLGADLTSRLTQNQFDALVADAFNAGSGGALRANMMEDIRVGNMSATGQQFNAWHAIDRPTQRRVIDPGLIRRNLREAAIFNNSDYQYNPTDDQVNTIWRKGK